MTRAVFTTSLKGEVNARVALVALALLVSPATLRAQDVRASAEGAPPRLALSESMRLTLTLEGPKPLLVTLPEKLLTADANAAWRVRPDGPATVSTIGNGRERWQRTYRFSPWDAGDPLVLRFNPATVNGQSVTWQPVPVTVTKTVDPATAPHGPVGVEEPPPPPINPPPSPAPLVALGVGSAATVVALLVLTRKRRARSVPPREAALAALSELLAVEAPAAERISAVVRAFVDRAFGVPATTLTTPELLVAAREQKWSVDQSGALAHILDTCDLAKFAGDVPDGDTARQLVRLAIDWIEDVSRPPAPAA